MSWRQWFVILSIWAISGTVFAAATCQKTGTVCVDGPSTKVISGASIYRDCWNYKDTYSCIDPLGTNYCQNLEASTPVCYVNGTNCNSTGWNGTCLDYTMTYQCKNAPVSNTSNITVLPTTYQVASDTFADGCTALAASSSCSVQATTCIDGPSTKTINGLAVTRPCWNAQSSYSCIGALTDNCASLKARPECSKTSSYCLSNGPSGSCDSTENIYTCGTPATVGTVTSCATQQFCIAGTCFGSGAPPDQDFKSVIASMEVAREAGSYELFKGEASSCSHLLGGLKNCCTTSGGGQSANNSAIANAIGASVTKVGVEYVKVYGSQYLYDGLSSLGSAAIEQMAYSNLSMQAGTLTAGSQFGVYGMQFSLSAANGLTFVGFDPWSLAMSVAIQVVMSMMTCSSDEQTLGMKRGQNLCHYVGTYCANKFLGMCTKTNESYCCFTSRLARIINEQGRGQIGKGWGPAAGPDCTGFTSAEFAKLDLEKMDLREFIAEIIPANKTSDSAFMRVQQQAKSYYKN